MMDSRRRLGSQALASSAAMFLRRIRPSTWYCRMRSSLFRRTFWLLFSLWLGPSIVVPELIDQCPVHSFAAGADKAHASHAARAGHNQTPTDHASHRGCTCLDQGCASNAATLPTKGHKVISIVRFIAGPASTVESDRLPTVAADFLLPPTTGPPPRA